MARSEFTGTSRFEVLRYLGAGGMGAVYAARDRDRDARVAIKTLLSDDPEYLLRFKREFRAVQDIQHPNLVNLGELFCEEGQWFFTMELVEGSDLRSYVRTDGSPGFNEDRLRSSVAQLADGLCALHAGGKVHRDIKPANVLVTPSGRAVLLDFGLVADRDVTADSGDVQMVGTAAYMAPEQGVCRTPGPPADWYGVGVVLYELLTGVVPFVGPSLQVAMEKQSREPVAPAELVPDLPRDLGQIALRLLAREPARRADGQALLRVLHGATAPSDQAFARASTPSSAPVFVGRARELTLLRDAFADAMSDGARAVVLRGESGVGKSSLVRRFTHQVTIENMDTVVLSGRCYERETVPFKALDRAIDELSAFLASLPEVDAALLVPMNAPLLARLFPVLQRVDAIAAAPWSHREPPNKFELRNRAFAALRDLIARVGDRYPLVIYIDDLQWADADSVTLLHELLREPSPRLLLLGTVRGNTDESAMAASLVRQLPIPAQEIELTSLPPDEARTLAVRLARRLGAGDSPLIDAIVSEGAGHPMFIHELVRYVGVTGETARGDVRLEGALWGRVEALPEPARQLLAVVAVAGAPIQQRVVGRAVGMAGTELERWLSLLRAGHLLRSAHSSQTQRIDVYHGRVRDAVLERVSYEQQERMHVRIARALESEGVAESEPQTLVRHLWAGGENHRAAERAAVAAERAASGFAFDRAAELYEIALRLGEFEPARTRELHLRRAEALSDAARCHEAADEFLAAGQGADPGQRLECQRQAAIQLLVSGHLERGIDTLRGVLAGVGLAYPDSPRRALVSALAGRTWLALRGRRWKTRHADEIPRERLTVIDVCGVVATALGTVDTVRGLDFQTRFLLRALEAGEPHRVAMALTSEAAFLASRGPRSQARARRHLRDSERIAAELGDPVLTAWTAGSGGLVDYFSCELAQADVRLDRGETILLEQTRGNAWILSTVRVFRLWTLRYLGHCEQMRELSDRYLRDAERCGDQYLETTLVRSSIVGWLELNRVDDAMVRLTESLWSPPEEGYHLQHWYQLRGLSELALYRRGEGQRLSDFEQEFEALASSLLSRVFMVRVEAAWSLGRLALMEAELTADNARLLQLAVRMARRMGRGDSGYIKLFGALLLAGVEYLRGRDDRAIRELALAEQTAEQRSMRSYAAAIRRRRGELLGGDEGARLISASDDFFTEQGVVVPASMVDVIAPGFRRPA